jgi:DNA-binding response OmpR family regulator
MPSKITVVEDDADIANLLVHYLGQEGYDVTVVPDGAAALQRIKTMPPDLILLDLMLPKMDGLEVCKRLRAEGRTATIPVIMLTAKGEESDRVIGLELGADDYLPKPFSPKELVARVKALLRRTNRPESAEKRFIYGELALDTVRHEVTFKGEEVHLTAKEFALLHQLLANRGRVLTREVLLDRVWGYEADVTTRTVDVHVRRLREKIPLLVDAILTVKSMGYKLRDNG